MHNLLKFKELYLRPSAICSIHFATFACTLDKRPGHSPYAAPFEPFVPDHGLAHLISVSQTSLRANHCRCPLPSAMCSIRLATFAWCPLPISVNKVSLNFGTCGVPWRGTAKFCSLRLLGGLGLGNVPFFISGT